MVMTIVLLDTDTICWNHGKRKVETYKIRFEKCLHMLVRIQLLL